MMSNISKHSAKCRSFIKFFVLTKNPMNSKIAQLIYWLPRILSILFIAFLAMFSLDIFDGNYGFWGTILGLFMHNIPVFILITLLIFSWKREWLGGIVFILGGIILMLTNALKNNFEWYMISYTFIIAGPAFLIGILFLIDWQRKKKIQK